MRLFRASLISALSSSLALFSACAVDDSNIASSDEALTATQRELAPAAQRTPFMTGELGRVTLPGLRAGEVLRGQAAQAFADSALSFVHGFALDHLGALGNEDFVASSVREDGAGSVGIRFEQLINNLPVAGAQLFVLVSKDGTVTRVNGNFVPGQALSDVPALGAEQAISQALAGKSVDSRDPDAALTYVLNKAGNAVLAWSTTVEYMNEQGPQRDMIFADAATGELVASHPQIHYARSLQTYNCNSKTTNCSLVSSSSNAINTGDGAIDAAHNFAIATYDYYWNNHGRDSIDNAGMTLKSRAHYSTNYNNAFWDGSQMTYGDGDGTTFIPLSQDADVVAHELTHGVTERSSGLIYSNESGALNEAWSDIFGSEVDRATGATGADIWLLGEDIYTPAIPGDGLRVMNDPAAAGDYDYYPTRYTGTSDNGGVHWNSGIANLAYVLLVEGGSHPRGKTSTVVPAIGNVKAAKIFYYANVSCMGPSTNFQGARDCTAAGAAALYGQAEVDAVHAAWDAVGVPGGAGGGGGGGCDQPYSDSLSGISGSRRSKQYYSQDVPACATSLTISISGGSGDADLYVKFGSQPTTSSFDCRPYLAGNNEICTFTPPQAGTYEIMLYGYSAYSGVTLTASYQ